MYNFKINTIKTNDGSTITPKKINIIIGPNSSGKSRFLKDIKNSLGNNNFPKKENIIIKEMNYELPKDRAKFIERYQLNDRIFSFDTNQTYISNYSGIDNNASLSVDGQFSNYLDSGNISISSNWDKDLDKYISCFKGEIEADEQRLIDLNLPTGAVIHNYEYAEYEENGEKKRVILGGGSIDTSDQISNYIASFINEYGKLFFNYLGTEEKLLMSKKQRKYGIEEHNTNFLSGTQLKNEMLNELSDYTKTMFHKDVYLDRYTFGDKILFRVGDDFEFIRNSPRDDGSAEIKLKNYNLLDDEGDGIKSFVSTFIALKSNDKNILLLDEPESFLHPPLAKQLGEIIARSASEDKQIFLSTHSVNLLKGILGIEKDVNIIRISREGDINHINTLEETEVHKIFSNSLLCSANTLNGLFCEKVYICESEADEEIYQLIHDKVNLSDSALFIHAKNKQTMKDIAEAYNTLKVPNYRIYDFDLLMDDDFNNALNGFIPNTKKDEYINFVKDSRKFFQNETEEYIIDKSVIENYISSSNQLTEILDKESEKYNIPKELKTAFLKDCKKISEYLKANHSNYYNGGLELVADEDIRNKLNALFEDLKNNGIIILKTGCLESIFKNLGLDYSSNKKAWYPKALSLLEDINSEDLEKSSLFKWLFD